MIGIIHKKDRVNPIGGMGGQVNGAIGGRAHSVKKLAKLCD